METDFEDRLRNNASCIIRSGGSRPSDKGGGGGEVGVHPDPEVRGAGGGEVGVHPDPEVRGAGGWGGSRSSRP